MKRAAGTGLGRAEVNAILSGGPVPALGVSARPA
jgi:hypothetical protein